MTKEDIEYDNKIAKINSLFHDEKLEYSKDYILNDRDLLRKFCESVIWDLVESKLESQNIYDEIMSMSVYRGKHTELFCDDILEENWNDLII